jgi:predicted ATPase
VLKERAETLCTVARESGFPVWLATGMVSIGRVMLEDGDWERGAAMMREGLKLVRDAGGELIYLYLLMLFAEGCLVHRRSAEGFETLELAFEGIRQNDMRLTEAELYRLRGDFILLDGNDQAKAEEEYRTAIRIAQEQGAKAWELRAATSLGRLMMASGRRIEARDVIASVYGWFTEGFETRDLKHAKELLREVSAS